VFVQLCVEVGTNLPGCCDCRKNIKIAQLKKKTSKLVIKQQRHYLFTPIMQGEGSGGRRLQFKAAQTCHDAYLLDALCFNELCVGCSNYQDKLS
jgi:hypothetical protein